MIGFHFNRSVSTNLKLNGPTLAYLTQPVDTTESITGVATFTGIATATYPPSSGDIVEGTYEFHWYPDNADKYHRRHCRWNDHPQRDIGHGPQLLHHLGDW